MQWHCHKLRCCWQCQKRKTQATNLLPSTGNQAMECSWTYEQCAWNAFKPKKCVKLRPKRDSYRQSESGRASGRGRGKGRCWDVWARWLIYTDRPLLALQLHNLFTCNGQQNGSVAYSTLLLPVAACCTQSTATTRSRRSRQKISTASELCCSSHALKAEIVSASWCFLMQFFLLVFFCFFPVVCSFRWATAS